MILKVYNVMRSQIPIYKADVILPDAININLSAE
jgi:hypothetical protein